MSGDSSPKTAGDAGETTIGFTVAYVVLARALIERGAVEGDIKDLKEDVRGIRSDMRVDFRLTFGALIVTAIGLAGIMAHGFKWL